MTLVERSQTDVEQFLEMLRFKNRSEMEVLSLVLCGSEYLKGAGIVLLNVIG
jgi:hypothetical protein